MNREERTPEQEKKTAPKKRVFLECGTNLTPVTWIGSREFPNSELYIGIDINAQKVKEAKELTFDRQPNMHFFPADAADLPFGDESVDELLLGNFLGDDLKISEAVREKSVQEAARALHKGGVLIIKEIFSPADERYVQNLLSKNNFEIEKIIRSGDSGWEDEIRKYDWVEADRKTVSRSYLIFAKKKQAEK